MFQPIQEIGEFPGVQAIEKHPWLAIGAEIEGLRAGERENPDAKMVTSLQGTGEPFPVFIRGNSPRPESGMKDAGCCQHVH